MTAVGGNTPYAKDGATWKEWDDFYANDSGTWKSATNVYVNDNGTWKEVWNHVPLLTSVSASDTTATPSFTQVSATNYGTGNATLGITSGVTGSYSEIFYLYRKSGATTYTESTSQSLTGLDWGGETAVTYFHKAVGYNGNRQVTVSGSINNNGFYLSSIKVQYGNSTALGSEVEVTVPAPNGSGVHSFSRTIALPILTRGATDTYSTFYYRIVTTNASGTTTGSINSISPQVKYSPSNYSTINTGELSFSNYRYRTDTYSTAGTYTWTLPTAPTGGVPITTVSSIELIGGGGGGAKGDVDYSISEGGIFTDSTYRARYGGAGGGGAGAYNAVNNINVGVGATATVVVGARGRGGLRDGNTSRAGEAGGSSSFTSGSIGYTASGGTGGYNAYYWTPTGGDSYHYYWGYRSGGGGTRVWNGSQYTALIGGGGAGHTWSGGSASTTTAGGGGGGQYSSVGGGGGGAGAYIRQSDGAVISVTNSGYEGGGNGVGKASTNLTAADATGVGCGGGGVADGRETEGIFPNAQNVTRGGNGTAGRVTIGYVGP